MSSVSRWTGPGGPAIANRLVVRDDFGADPDGTAYVRRLVGLVLRVWGLDDSDIWSLATAAAGLVEAGPWVGDGRMTLRLHRQAGRVVMEVHDRSRPDLAPEPGYIWRKPGGSATRFVDQIADAWGTRTDQDGTAVWLVKHTTPA